MKRSLKFIIFLLVILSLVVSVFAGMKEDIYSKIKCCDCGKKFAVCACAHAKEMKVYIDALTDVGLSEEEILEKIAKKYTLNTIIDSKARKSIEKKLIAAAGEKRPQIFIDPLVYDLGKVSKSKGKLQLKVKIKNKGKDVLKITNLKPSCVCVTVKLKSKNYTSPIFGTKGAEPGWEASIASKKKGVLTIMVDLNHSSIHLGHMMRTVEVKSNDPVRPSITIEFKAVIIE